VETPLRHKGGNCLLSLTAYVKREIILWMVNLGPINRQSFVVEAGESVGPGE
jgi:hypothetical protein